VVISPSSIVLALSRLSIISRSKSVAVSEIPSLFAIIFTFERIGIVFLLSTTL
jgi:hypothetical protein